jgi:hypothetical protein
MLKPKVLLFGRRMTRRNFTDDCYEYRLKWGSFVFSVKRLPVKRMPFQARITIASETYWFRYFTSLDRALSQLQARVADVSASLSYLMGGGG